MCSESRTTSDIEDSELKLINYTIVRCDSHSRHTSGVLIYVHETIEYKVIYNNSFDQNMWCIIIKIKTNGTKLCMGLLYHSPNSNDSDFINYLCENVLHKFEPSDNNLLTLSSEIS